MLNQDDVNKEEEAIRINIQNLSNEDRKILYSEVKTKIKDPDTYATLNWFFITGIHHFYLGKWIKGILDLVIFIIGIILIILGYSEMGIFLIIFISIVELYALFRSQIIIQDWNNQVHQKALQRLSNEIEGVSTTD